MAKVNTAKEPEAPSREADPTVERKGSSRAGKQQISIFDAWCKQCGLCVDFCPKGVLTKRALGSPQVSLPEQCIGCLLCVLHCPDFAISVTAKEETGDKSEV
ncbi:MAG: 4Fe-4S binding protein [Armatimonadota bacterium]|nr:4Fe-4S binding protein [Armatimonadota bacterium]